MNLPSADSSRPSKPQSSQPGVFFTLKIKENGFFKLTLSLWKTVETYFTRLYVCVDRFNYLFKAGEVKTIESTGAIERRPRLKQDPY